MFVLSVNGVMEEEIKIATKNLAVILSNNWYSYFSTTCWYFHARLSLNLLWDLKFLVQGEQIGKPQRARRMSSGGAEASILETQGVYRSV